MAMDMMTDTNKEEMAGWEMEMKKYYLDDPARMCFVEKDKSISGAPLWPYDDTLHVSDIDANLARLEDLLSSADGHVFHSNIELNHDRTLEALKCSDKPRRLATTFTSGFLLPTDAIETSRCNFYPCKGTIPQLHDIIRSDAGAQLVINLGYFITKKLILDKQSGGLPYSHNERHLEDEHLPESCNSYLGGFFIRRDGRFIAYPPHFGTAGVGITKSGKPILIDDIELKGGSVDIGGRKIAWKQSDINPKAGEERKVSLYTPALMTDATDGCISSKAWNDYRPMIGDDRVNIVIVNEGTGTCPAPKIGYVKSGTILQPAAGIVLSLDSDYFDEIFPEGEAWLMGNGRSLNFEFEPWFDKKLWDELTSFYEGLISLDSSGVRDLHSWLHPNAVMSQETFIPNLMRREPRSILVKTKKYFGAFVFSGRYEYSLGISISEIAPAMKLILNRLSSDDDIEKILVLDGGSGARCCLVLDGKLLPLSWAAPGARNRIGDAGSNVYSTLHLKLDVGGE